MSRHSNVISSFVLIFFVTLATLCLACLGDDNNDDKYLINNNNVNNNNNNSNNNNNNVAHNISYYEQESGYDIGAYPSHIVSHIDRSDGLTRILASVATINVDDFGAKGDANHDDTMAFQRAWKSACSSSTRAVYFQVPKKKKYLLKPISFSGPCNSAITFQIYGKIEASDDRSDYEDDRRHWIQFLSVQNLVVDGGGVGSVNGNGRIWWQNSCKINPALPCKHAPTALTFYKCKNLAVKNLKIQNAQQVHVSFENCTNVHASNLVVTAPEDSPNTDGIHVAGTKHIQISDCTIRTGDDCISIVSGSQYVEATDITCGPGHGISIGSLGSENSKAYVNNVIVNGAKLHGTSNGVRIKTWQGGSGSASNIKFQNIEMSDVKNPIIIDQNYCDQNEPCKQQNSAVQVKNVLYENITGTSATKTAIEFECSKSHPCQGIVLHNVRLEGEGDEDATAACNNVKFSNLIGTVSPKCPNAQS